MRELNGEIKTTSWYLQESREFQRISQAMQRYETTTLDLCRNPSIRRENTPAKSEKRSIIKIREYSALIFLKLHPKLKVLHQKEKIE